MSSTYIPADVRRDLWIASGGRCEFRGCNKAIDRNFLTRQRVVLSEFCHIVGDSSLGPRGDQAKSAELAKDPQNLILCCTGCHKTIDDNRLAPTYSVPLLLAMKREHEQHVQRLYDATGIVRSIPFLVTGRIKGTPTSIQVDVARAAVLRKTRYVRFPSYEEEVLDLNEIPGNESDSLYWEATKARIDRMMDGLLDRVTDREIEHIDLFALAQIPTLAYVGFRLGDRVPLAVHQPQRAPLDRWDWPALSETPLPIFTCQIPPGIPTGELAVVISLSGSVRHEDVTRALPGIPVATLSVENPSPSLVDREAVQHEFSNVWRGFLAELHRSHGRIKTLHVFPAIPASLAVELGRSVHPKVRPELNLWDYVDGQFVKAISW